MKRNTDSKISSALLAARFQADEERGDRDRAAFVAEQLEGELGHDSGAVAGAAVGQAAAAMLDHALQRAEGPGQVRVACFTGGAGDEADSAGRALDRLHGGTVIARG
jgi:hypothetical protein